MFNFQFNDMALSLDDRLLGEKVDNYCSSSEDEGPDEQLESTVPQPESKNIGPYKGFATNVRVILGLFCGPPTVAGQEYR